MSFPALTRVQPSFVEPGILMQFSQASGFASALATGKPQTRLGSEDQYVYISTLSMRSKAAVGQSAYNQLPSCTMVPSQISTPTYLWRTRAEYDHHDTAAAGNWGISLPEAQRLAMRQAIFQGLRNSAIFGVTAGAGEGFLNTAGATASNFPADPNAHTTAVTMDDGFMAQQLLNYVAALKTRCNSIGIALKLTILAPQRIISLWQYAVVELTSFQRQGSGSASVTGTVESVAAWNGDDITFAVDDTLINKGAGGTTDAIILIAPELEVPEGRVVNTNEFALLTPGLLGTSLMYSDMAAPREIPTPIAGGAIDVVSELRATPGWVVRPEALTIISLQFS